MEATKKPKSGLRDRRYLRDQRERVIRKRLDSAKVMVNGESAHIKAGMFDKNTIKDILPGASKLEILKRKSGHREDIFELEDIHVYN